MKNLSPSVVKSWREWMLPLCLTITFIANFVFFYLGLCLKENRAREIAFILVAILFAIGSGLSFLRLLGEKILSPGQILLLAAVLLYFVAAYAVRYLSFGTSGDMPAYAARFITLCIPPFFCGACAAAWKTEGSYVEKLERLTFLIVPGAVFYSFGLLFESNPFNYGADLGIIDYMAVAYTIMPFLFAHIIRFADDEPFELPVLKRAAKRPQLLRGCLIALYWYAILASGTRGCYVCVSVFCIALYVSRRIHRQRARRTAILSFIMIGALLLSVFVVRVPGLARASRMGLVIEGAAEGKFVTSEDSLGEYENDIGALANHEGGMQIVNLDPGDEDPEDPTANLIVKSRGTLWKLAFLEFKKSPLTGMRPGGYIIKYGMYPHNVPLELLCETGIVGTIPLAALILLAAFRILRAGLKRRECRYLLLFFLAYALRACITSTLWECPALLCALGYGLALQPEKPAKDLPAPPLKGAEE